MHRYGSSRRQFILKNKAAFKIQVLSMLVIKCQGKFIIFQFASAMHQQKNCLGLRRNFCIFVGNGFGIPQHFAKGYDLFFQQLILILPVLFTCSTLKREKQKTIFLLLITLFWFLCVSLL